MFFFICDKIEIGDNMRYTKRYILDNIDNLNLSNSLRYERYYINSNLRIQKRGNSYSKEILLDNEVISKVNINEQEFNKLRETSTKEIVRDSYLYLDDERISIKKYYGDYIGLIRIEVKLNSEDEVLNYIPLDWFGKEITDSPLAFDSYLINLSKKEFMIELEKYKD